MMKWAGIMVVLVHTFSFNQVEMEEIRVLYQRAAESPEAAEKLMEMTAEVEASQVLRIGYQGAAHMMMAKHVMNPFSKMSHFKKGKKIFNSAVARAPDNLELRFLRFAVQSEAPGFLGYRGSLKEDKEVLISGVDDIPSPQAKHMIVQYLLKSSALSAREKEEIKEKIQ